MKKITLITLILFALTSVAVAAPLMEFEKGKVAIDYTFRPSLDFSGTGKVNGYIGDIGPLTVDKSFSYSGTRDFDGDSNIELGLTIGIGNRWALQYRQYNPTGTIYSNTFNFNPQISVEPQSGGNETIMKAPQSLPASVSVNFEGKIRSDEYNLLYSLNKNWAAFVGVVRFSGGVAASGSGSYGDWSGHLSIPELWSEQKDNFQFGVVGSYKIAPKTHFWGLASFAGDYRNWEAGLSYDIGKDLQFNVNYRDTKFDKLKFAAAGISPPSGSGLHASSAEVSTDVTVKGWGFGLTYKF